jgi:archaellum component FlaF (FlaF/FlaG flagellin family)
MGVSVVLASFIVLIGFVAVFSTVSTAFFTGIQDITIATNDYVDQQKDKINAQTQLTVDSVSSTTCSATIKNTGSKIIFLQDTNGFNWNTIILSYGDNNQWNSYTIESFTVQEIRVTGTNTTFNTTTNNFINPGEQVTITINIPNGAPEIASQDIVSVTFASYYGTTSASESVME